MWQWPGQPWLDEPLCLSLKKQQLQGAVLLGLWLEQLMDAMRWARTRGVAGWWAGLAAQPCGHPPPLPPPLPPYPPSQPAPPPNLFGPEQAHLDQEDHPPTQGFPCQRQWWIADCYPILGLNQDRSHFFQRLGRVATKNQRNTTSLRSKGSKVFTQGLSNSGFFGARERHKATRSQEEGCYTKTGCHDVLKGKAIHRGSQLELVQKL